jgi:hypothetical protein
MVRVNERFQISLNLRRSSGVAARVSNPSAPAAITAWGDMSGMRLGTSVMIVVKVMVWPTAIDIALESC